MSLGEQYGFECHYGVLRACREFKCMEVRDKQGSAIGVPALEDLQVQGFG